MFFDGKGNFTTELQGGGQEQVEADAVKAAEEIKAFADVIAITAPYSDALARRGLLSFGAPYMSAEWMAARRPYAWSPTVDCTFLQQSVSDYVNKRLAGKNAKYAAGDLKGKPRTFALLAPENPWYQQCVDAGEKVAKAAGDPYQARIAYKLDFNTLSNQAASVIAKLKSEKITSVICGCDPAFPIFLTSKAQEQGYSPEWLITGAGFIDLDILGQLYQQDQWSHALGVSFIGALQPLRATLGYHAFKSVRPNEEPSILVDLLYYDMYMLAIGVQLAGPQLNPETFERGMYAYPGGSGPAGTWKFSPGRYTPTQDAREIYWDRNAVSPQNKEKGSYVDPQPGSASGPVTGPPPTPPSPSGDGPAPAPRRSGDAPPILVAAALVAIWPLAAALLPHGAPVGVVLTGVVLGTATGLLAVGLVLVYRTNRIVNFAYGAIGRWPACSASSCTSTPGGTTSWPWASGWSLGFALGGIVELLVIRRFARSSRLVLTVATIGLAQVLGGVELLVPEFFGGQRRPLGGFVVAARRQPHHPPGHPPGQPHADRGGRAGRHRRPGLVPRPHRRRHRHAGLGREHRPGPAPRHPRPPAVDAGVDRRRGPVRPHLRAQGADRRAPSPAGWPGPACSCRRWPRRWWPAWSRCRWLLRRRRARGARAARAVERERPLGGRRRLPRRDPGRAAGPPGPDGPPVRRVELVVRHGVRPARSPPSSPPARGPRRQGPAVRRSRRRRRRRPLIYGPSTTTTLSLTLVWAWSACRWSC